MKIEDQVCSLELAKRLKELGIKQESYFYWENIPNCGYVISYDPSFWEDMYSAFSVAELGEMLPSKIQDYNLTIVKCGYLYDLMYSTRYDDIQLSYRDIEDINLANAMAKMLIHLLENGYVKAEDL